MSYFEKKPLSSSFTSLTKNRTLFKNSFISNLQDSEPEADKPTSVDPRRSTYDTLTLSRNKRPPRKTGSVADRPVSFSSASTSNLSLTFHEFLTHEQGDKLSNSLGALNKVKVGKHQTYNSRFKSLSTPSMVSDLDFTMDHTSPNYTIEHNTSDSPGLDQFEEFQHSTESVSTNPTSEVTSETTSHETTFAEESQEETVQTTIREAPITAPEAIERKTSSCSLQTSQKSSLDEESSPEQMTLQPEEINFNSVGLCSPHSGSQPNTTEELAKSPQRKQFGPTGEPSVVEASATANSSQITSAPGSPTNTIAAVIVGNRPRQPSHESSNNQAEEAARRFLASLTLSHSSPGVSNSPNLASSSALSLSVSHTPLSWSSPSSPTILSSPSQRRPVQRKQMVTVGGKGAKLKTEESHEGLEGELSFGVGEVVLFLEKDDSGWGFGKLCANYDDPDAAVGWFPLSKTSYIPDDQFGNPLEEGDSSGVKRIEDTSLVTEDKIRSTASKLNAFLQQSDETKKSVRGGGKTFVSPVLAETQKTLEINKKRDFLGRFFEHRPGPPPSLFNRKGKGKDKEERDDVQEKKEDKKDRERREKASETGKERDRERATSILGFMSGGGGSPSYSPANMKLSKKSSVFGIHLEYLSAKQKDYAVPYVVFSLVSHLKSAKNLLTEGLFRVSGKQSDVEKLKSEYKVVVETVVVDKYDTHTAASALKQYFAQLPEPLFTYVLYDHLIEFISSRKESEGEVVKEDIKTLRSVLEGRLPSCHFLVMKYLFHFLYLVAKESQHNLMAASNLGTVFGPTLLRPKVETPANLMSSHPAHLVEFMIGNCSHIFS